MSICHNARKASFIRKNSGGKQSNAIAFLPDSLLTKVNYCYITDGYYMTNLVYNSECGTIGSVTELDEAEILGKEAYFQEGSIPIKADLLTIENISPDEEDDEDFDEDDEDFDEDDEDFDEDDEDFDEDDEDFDEEEDEKI